MSLKKIKIDGRLAEFSYKGDVEPVLERNKLLRTMEETNVDGMSHYATIPNEIMLQWLNEAWMAGQDVRYLSPEFYALVDKKLKDPDWARLLVGGPRHKVGYGN